MATTQTDAVVSITEYGESAPIVLDRHQRLSLDRLRQNKFTLLAGPDPESVVVKASSVVGAISNGEVALGVSGYTALAEAQKRKGAPIEWAPLATMPVGPLFMFMLKGAPQPNLGKLFLAWLATEGAEIQEKEEYLSLFHDPDSATTQRIKAMMPDVKVVEVRTEEKLRESEAAAKQIMNAVASVAGK